MNRTIYCEAIDHHFVLPKNPTRIISLLPSATEALYQMGFIDRVVGVSDYCRHYVPELDVPQVGQYVSCDIDQIIASKPELIITTGGIQQKLAARLSKEGLPVFVIPLPQSFYGILENIRTLGRLLNQLEAARKLTASMTDRAALIRKNAPACRPKIYMELWIGKDMRAVGGGSYIQDLVEIAGAELVYQNDSTDYLTPDFSYVESQKPDAFLFFHEPEHQINPSELIWQRRWNPQTQVIMSTVLCGENVIQDGPSLLDTAEWLQQQLLV